MEKVKLNLGCGKDYKKGYINVDNTPYVKKDVDADLEKYPLPFKNNYADEIKCMAVLEHLESPLRFLEEVHRILKPGGKFKFRVPMAFSYVDSCSLTHKSHFIPETFNHFLKKSKYTQYTQRVFSKANIWVTIPFFHKLRFPKKLHFLNCFVNNIFTGIEGELYK
tara:strand:- start:18 stop:512 length:495 start_codon:yes stop_codon:yes gene_type:complete